MRNNIVFKTANRLKQLAFESHILMLEKPFFAKVYMRDYYNADFAYMMMGVTVVSVFGVLLVVLEFATSPLMTLFDRDYMKEMKKY